MKFVRPRLNDYHGVPLSQEQVDFAIPFLDEDLPLYVDPFLLWKSPSQQDNSLHIGLVNTLNKILKLESDEESEIKLNELSECDEVGLGGSANRKGNRIGVDLAGEIRKNVKLLADQYRREVEHLSEIGLITPKIGKDRISDFTCSLIKSFLIDFTIDQCTKWNIPVQETEVKGVLDSRTLVFHDVKVSVPVNPKTLEAILFVPKRWLRFSPWINYEDYFKNHYFKKYVEEDGEHPGRVEVLTFNRDNYDQVVQYLKLKEREFADCKNDPLFSVIPNLSAKRCLNSIKKLPTGKTDNADYKYEDQVCKLLPSLLYPHLDFADVQSRTDSGVLIRDLIFYNNRGYKLLEDFWDTYKAKQIVFELKNVKELSRDHVNQLNRYMKDSFGHVGIFVTRNEPPNKIKKNLIDLWSGQRKCILVITDQDLEMMVNVFESKQRDPIEVLNKKFVEFMRDCPG